MVIMGSLRRTLSVTKFETKKHRTRDEKKIIIVLAMLGLLVYGSVSVFMELGITGNEAFYRFSTEDSRIEEVLLATGKFIEAPEAEADVFIEADGEHIFVFADSTDRGKAAVFSLEAAIKAYNNLIYEDYDKRYAFPLRINVIEVQRDDDSFGRAVGESMGLREYDAQPDEDDDPGIPEETVYDEAGSVEGTREEDTGEEPSIPETPDEDILEEETQTDVERHPMQEATQYEREEQDVDYMSAQDMNPFSQFGALIVVVLLTLPLAMISLVYSNSMMAEKMNKRGIFLLMAPISRLEIIAGKTLPYFILSLSVFVPVIISNTQGVMPALAASAVAIAVILAYLSISFTSAMLSRSHKELSFIAIFFISLYSCYLLIPAFMMNFSLISLASPLTIIAKLFRNEAIGIQLVFFAVVPTLVSAIVIFFAGSKLMNDTNMFSYESISKKIESSVYHIVRRRHTNIFFVAFFSVPLIFLIQLMMIVVLLSLRNISALILLMLFGALVEEIFKNLGPYVLINQDRKGATLKRMGWYALLAGAGFFVAEKALMLVMIAPFLEAYAALAMTGLLIPFVLHTGISFVFCISAKRFKKGTFTKSIAIATAIHFAINMTLSIMATGGML